MAEEAEATTDNAAVFHEIALLIWKERLSEARRLLYPIARRLEIEFDEGIFRREDWEKLAELNEGLEEYGAASKALGAIEARCGWDPVQFIRRLRLRGRIELPTVVYREFAARRADLPPTPEVAHEAVKFVHSIKPPAGFTGSGWFAFRHELEDEWMRAAPNDPDAFRGAASVAIHLNYLRRAKRIVDQLRVILLTQSAPTVLHWVRLSELEERLGRDKLSLDSAIRGFRADPSDLNGLRRIGRFYPAVTEFLTAAEINAGFAAALKRPSLSADHLALIAESLLACGRQAMAADAVARALAIDPKNARAAIAANSADSMRRVGSAAELMGETRRSTVKQGPVARAWRWLSGGR